MYEHILVPTDGSPGSENATKHALELAEQFGATVHALYVESPNQDFHELDRRPNPPSSEEALSKVTDLAAKTSVTVETAIEVGTPHERIRDYSEEHDIDLIVLGTHARTGVDRYLLGSVTERVIRSVDTPTLVVRLDKSDFVVTTADQAIELAVDALREEGYDDVSVEEDPYREEPLWVVRADADGESRTVYVDNRSGNTRVLGKRDR
ncbi:universal stress protein [Haloarchaeobius amylolyticus]|uniref:universal stress protein n=1 Tax=Haloarchaeobius amylolyticus TaxID=1198296 RepID=UPI002271759A|nr:universal stress protein [Haloarchaeobius amylolyticus]